MKFKNSSDTHDNISSRIPKPAKFAIVIGVPILVVALLAFGVWYWFAPTTIQGIDVSNYQGTISWKAVAQNSSLHFVYIKATEGKSYTDASFQSNWAKAADSGLKVGAYHYFSATSSGADQARHFIATVPKKEGTLPPVVDIEANITQESDYKNQIADFVRLVQAHYGQKPVFYVPPRIFDLLYDDYSSYPFWVIAVKTSPHIQNWTFLQYSDSGSIVGIDGNVDFDKYQGSRWSFIHLS